MATELQQILAQGGLRTAFQPIVDLRTGAVVAYEALTRGPAGSPLERPDRLFAAAGEERLLAELDTACLRTAFANAARVGFGAGMGLFVNVEPRTLDSARSLAEEPVPDALVVVELTERALLARPADLLHTVALARRRGWAVALDDVGADPRSLALLPIVQPDLVKLDLRLVQDQPDRHTAAIATAVQAEAERSGMRILAEGVETEAQLQFARSLGATFSQGWLHGRPEAEPDLAGRTRVDLTELLRGDTRPAPQQTPAELVHPHHELRRATKPLLIQISKHLERQAKEAGDTAILLGTFQHARFFGGDSARRYRDLADVCAFVGAFGVEMPFEPAAGVRGGLLEAGDRLEGEWDVVVIGAHFAGALVAVDLGDQCAEEQRRFDYLVTYDRDIVQDLARSLLVRIWPDLRQVERSESVISAATGAVVLDDEATPLVVPDTFGPEHYPLLARALGATAAGVTVADARRPDQPLVYVNEAFERLTGYGVQEALGRNCRFLQGVGTAPEAIDRMRAGIAQRRPVTVRVVNYRRDGTPWWNEVHLAPVFDDRGQLTHVVGVQHDVSSEVEATSQLRYLARHDQLTGLRNRASLVEDLQAAMAASEVVGLLFFLDLVGFKQVNDRHGHGAGDDLLRRVGSGVWSVLDEGATAYRLGGDEFVVLLQGPSAEEEGVAERVAGELAAAVARPMRTDDGSLVHVTATVGWSRLSDAATADEALRAADRHLYAVRRDVAGRPAGRR
ncbi:EAL domain-containing protein [Egicoccus halophilus]|uniref:PAS domain S-box-containing protein/diguanylate cyclase (GGDEF) domain-containing protein n=1 Tax=Egicoccus halophilus TaxID=1670830 RepID=A0A8J3A5N2_9ACTN|nr:EAL domain-containing protein [Egicoccus halophilus]GGI03277.1 hypothetical protein GCM10011354_03230 [Egicoccus halophilus]